MDRRRRYGHEALYLGCSPKREALVAIDNYRNCVEDEVGYLRKENHEMRARLAKLDQIQQRVQTLLHRDQHNICELQLLNDSIRCKVAEIEDLRICLEEEKIARGKLEGALRAEIQSLMEELGWVKRQREDERLHFERSMEEGRSKANTQIKMLEKELADSQFAAQKLAQRLEQMIRVVQAQREQRERQHTSVRLRLMQEIQEMSLRGENVSRQNGRLAAQNDSLKRDLASLVTQAQQLKQMNELVTMDKLRNDQERAQLLLDLKEVQRQLSTAHLDCNVFEQRMLAEQAQIVRVVEANKQLSIKIEDLQSELRKKNRLLDEYHSELRYEEQRYRGQVAQLTDNNITLQSLVETLKADNESLSARCSHLTTEVEAKTHQIRQLLYGIEKLEEKVLQFESKYRMLDTQKTTSMQKMSYLTQQKQSLMLQVRTLQQKLSLKETHVLELEQLVERRDREVQDLRKTSCNVQQISRKYEDEMLRMVKMFEDEKMKLQTRNQQQKARLKEMYEYELKDTHDLFQRKIRVFEEGIHK